MKAVASTADGSLNVLQGKAVGNPAPGDAESADLFAELERGVHAALETYSNVHRGSGHHSMVSTHLYEQARDIVLEYLKLNKDRYVVIFCTPTFTPIWNAVCQAWRQPKRVQQAIIQEVRSICADALGAPLAHYDVIFTSNTTEAINLAAESLGRESEPGSAAVVLNTLLEHNSNELPWRSIPGVSPIRLPVDAEGFVDMTELETLLDAYNHQAQHGKKRIKLVAVSGASNVLGTFNNLAAISRIVHRYGARLLVDAAQWVAHRGVDMDGCAIDYLAFSAHKVYAPFGTGALLVRKGLLHVRPAELELIQSSGEENVGGIAAACVRRHCVTYHVATPSFAGQQEPLLAT